MSEDTHINGIRQPVTPDVKHPSLYTSRSKRHCENEVSEFLKSLVYLTKPDLVVEVGVAEGYTSVVIGEAIARNGLGKLVGIDIDADQIPESVKWAIDNLPIELRVSDFQEVFFKRDERIDLIFLDATLDQKDIEFMHFFPWFRPGTIAVLHDMGFGKAMNMSSPKRAEIAFRRVDKRFYNRINFATPAGLAVLEVFPV